MLVHLLLLMYSSRVDTKLLKFLGSLLLLMNSEAVSFGIFFQGTDIFRRKAFENRCLGVVERENSSQDSSRAHLRLVA